LEFKRLGSHVVVELSEVLFKFVEAKTTWNVPLLLLERVLLLCTGVCWNTSSIGILSCNQAQNCNHKSNIMSCYLSLSLSTILTIGYFSSIVVI
jgi:hypothetical protein